MYKRCQLLTSKREGVRARRYSPGRRPPKTQTDPCERQHMPIERREDPQSDEDKKEGEEGGVHANDEGS